MIGECAETLERVEECAGTRFHRTRNVRGLLEQIGAPHVTDKHEIAGENAHRSDAARRIGDDE